MAEVVSFEKRGNIGVIALQNPPVNALGAAVRSGLMGALERGSEDPEIAAMVLIGHGRCFSGGADIREFGKPPVAHSPNLRAVIDMIEGCDKPVVAAIHGTAIGGGLELAMGCHFRLGDPSALVGQPEIKLGIIPGAGGTQRLPRLAGVGPALDMILSGDFVPAEQARDHGVIDLILPGDLEDAAVAFAEQLVTDGTPLRRTREIAVPKANAALIKTTREKIATRARNQIAPGRCIDAVAHALDMPFHDAMEKEREYFLECVQSEQSKGLRHIFFAERQAAKIPDVPDDTAVGKIERAAVIGCGTMGGGIAMNFANAGIPVVVVETAQEALDKGLAVVRNNYAGSVKRGRISQAQMDTRMGLMRGSTDFNDIVDADIVIEAVFEEMDIKKEVFAKLDALCKPGAILATNTSTLDVDEIAAATKRPEAVIGTHFFSPANVMRLMENVRGGKTGRETIATVMALSKRLGKVGVLAGVCDGFIGNRMLYAYTRQANFLLEEGALPQQVDKVIYDFGLPMGPFAMGDLAGLDVGWRIRKRQAATRRNDERYSPIADRICERGRYGQKTGAGWYRYEAGSRTPQPDPEIEALIVQVAKEQGVARRQISDQEILERCMYPLINEGAKILEEGIALRASDIDVVWVYGYGFPPYRGGPMFYADSVGSAKIYKVMQRLHEQHGDMLKPAPMLAELAKSGGRFNAQ